MNRQASVTQFFLVVKNMFQGKRRQVSQKRALGSLWKVLLLPVLLVFTALMVIAFSKTYSVDTEFAAYINTYEKKYDSNQEFKYRQEIFLQTKTAVEEFNLDEDAFALGINQFSDLTAEELYLSPLPALEISPYISHPTPKTPVSLPAAFDWAAQGLVTEVKNERNCETSWIFAPIAAAESLFAIANQRAKLMYEFSEQEVFDCCPGNLIPCQEGLAADAFTCMKNGIALEAAYPYEAVQGQCHSFNSTYAVSGSVSVPSVFEDILQALSLHPLVVSVDANSLEFRQYRSGIFWSSTCSTTVPNHYMLLVGFNTTSNPPYYKLKNSWGTAWGEEGYMRMEMDKKDGPGMCGVQANVLDPLIAT